jgi:hypothetical protein
MKGMKRPKRIVLPDEPGRKEPGRPFTHELVREQPYYLDGPQQGRPPDGKFAAGTRVALVSRSGNYCRVDDDAGVQAYVECESLKELIV